jgi:Ala-tRNA(Pro) deacylase
MAAAEAELFARLDQLGITSQTFHHPPVFTVEEAKLLRGRLPGAHCKSLFLKDKRGQLWLIVCLEDRHIDLKRLEPLIGAGRLSFGKAELLQEVLGVVPGSVTPFGLILDADRRVKVVLDRQMLAETPLNYHPLRNDRTTQIAPADLLRFIEACGHIPMIIDFDTLANASATP